MKSPKYILNYKIDWGFLSINTNAVHLLEQNQDKIDWCYLSANKNAIRAFKSEVFIQMDLMMQGRKRLASFKLEPTANVSINRGIETKNAICDRREK